MTLNFTLFAKWTLKKPWILLEWTLKNVKKDLENLEKTLKNTLKNAGNPVNEANEDGFGIVLQPHTVHLSQLECE